MEVESSRHSAFLSFRNPQELKNLMTFFLHWNKSVIKRRLQKHKLPKSAAAKSLQSCPTLRDPIDGSPPGSPVPGILQARTLEWVAISFSNSWKWKVKVTSLSHVQLSATPRTAAHQAPEDFPGKNLEWGVTAFSISSKSGKSRNLFHVISYIPCLSAFSYFSVLSYICFIHNFQDFWFYPVKKIGKINDVLLPRSRSLVWTFK